MTADRPATEPRNTFLPHYAPEWVVQWMQENNLVAISRGAYDFIRGAEAAQGAAPLDEPCLHWSTEDCTCEGAAPRKYRADFFLAMDLLVEVEGGAWINGRHSRGSGMESDCEKSALAAARGYRLVRVTPAQVNDGRALAWIQAAIAWRNRNRDAA